jgi:hypothetical protein
MRMTGFRRESRNSAKRGARGNGGREPSMPAGGVSCAAHGHRLRNPRPSRGRFPGPSGHRGLMARDAWAAGGWRGQAQGWHAVRRTRRATSAVQARPASGPPPAGIGGSRRPCPLGPRKTGRQNVGALHPSSSRPHCEGQPSQPGGPGSAPRAGTDAEDPAPHLMRPRFMGRCAGAPKGGAPDPHPARRPHTLVAGPVAGRLGRAGRD